MNTNQKMNKESNTSDPYVERATDILLDLIKKSRNKLPSAEKEAVNFQTQLRSVKQLDKIFSKNAEELMKLIKSKQKSKF